MAMCIRCDKNEKCEPFSKCIECINYGLTKAELIVSNVLAYINSYRHEGSELKISTACVKHFSNEDIQDAKEKLFKEYEFILCNPKVRKGGAIRGKEELNMEDIFEAFRTLDKKKIEVRCVAENVRRLPKYNPEEVELTSLLERVMKVENTLMEHGKRLDETFTRQLEGKNEVDESKRKVEEAMNEVQSVSKIVDDTREEVKKQESELKSVKVTYAQKALQGRSNVRNAVPDELPSGSSDEGWQPVNSRRKQGRQQPSGNDNGNGNGQPPRKNGNNKRSHYGSLTGNVNGMTMGAPLPSRFIVIERINKAITKEQVKAHTVSKNVNLRSIKLMSKENSMNKMYLLEVSVEQYNTVRNVEFWPQGVKFRPFKGNGHEWRDRDVPVQLESEASIEAETSEGENNNSSSSSSSSN